MLLELICYHLLALDVSMSSSEEYESDSSDIELESSKSEELGYSDKQLESMSSWPLILSYF